MSGEELIVIGAGPAGCAAAVQALRLGVRPIVLDAAGRAGGLLRQAWRVENYPGLPPLAGPRLAERCAMHLRRFGLAPLPIRVERLTPDPAGGWRLATDQGEQRARTVILATGTRPRPLDLPGAAPLTGRGLFYEVRDLLDARPAPGRVLVLGGGEAALDYALTLAREGVRVRILLRGALPRAAGRLRDAVERSPRIQVVTGLQALGVEENGGGVALLARRDGRRGRLHAGALLVAIGRSSTAPDLLAGEHAAPGPELAAAPGLFLAGDIRRGTLGQAGMAVGDGLAAAMAAVASLQPAGPRRTVGHRPAARPPATLRIVAEHGEDDLARVFVAETADGARIEFVESVQPPVPREQKWVLIISTLKGCPIGCPMCDAGGDYRGRLTAEEILAQIEHLILRRYPDGRVPVPKLKVQFARMGDPALNDEVLAALRALPDRWELPGLLPSLSTIAPRGRDRFFDDLARLKHELYAGGRFQMQFSLHSTDEQARRTLVPAATWSFAEIAAYGDRFHAPGDRRITLNFAAARDLPLEPAALAAWFSPERFMIKLTPINPTRAARRAGLTGLIDESAPAQAEEVAARFRAHGYETLVSIGETRENRIGSNCGMFAARSGPRADPIPPGPHPRPATGR